MATFSYEVSPYRRADGTHLIKIRMIHSREVVRKPSTIYVTRDQLSRDLSKVRDAAVLESINRQLDTFRKAVAAIDGAEYYTAAALWDAINARIRDEKGFTLDFFEYAETIIAKMEKSTGDGYKSSLNALKRFIGKDTLDINEITFKLLTDFRSFLETEPAVANGKGKRQTKSKGCRAVSFYLSHLQHIHRVAREEFNDDDIGLIRIPRQPFKSGLIPPMPTTEHRALTAEQIRKISTVELDNPKAQFARDVFMLSFMLVGMNTVDMHKVVKSDLKDGVLTYNRSKTEKRRKDKAIMKVRIEPEVLPYLERYKGTDRLFDFVNRYADHRTFNQHVNKGLKKVGEAVEIEGLTSYYPRHSWATIARNNCGVVFDEVSESLNHAKRGSDRVTDIYVERDWSRVWDANRKVLDYVLNPPTSGQSPAAATQQTPHSDTRQ